MKNTFETIIIGAGPAGLAAGMYLNDYLILDQKKEIGLPVRCAEGLSKKNLEMLRIEPDSSWISTKIDTSKVFLPNGKIILLSGKEAGYVLDRSRFEKFLAQKCQGEILLEKKIVDIKKENRLWQVTTKDRETFFSKYLIGADGPLSIVREKVFKEKVNFLPTLQFLVKLERKVNTSEIRMYFDKERFSSGYAWIFPKSENLANIGLGGEKNLKKEFEDFMENTVKKEFGNYELIEPRCKILSWGGANIKLFEDNAFLIGDAGALIEPIFGGGIGNAMISGQVAAKSILSGRAHSYEAEIKSMPFFSKDLLVAQEIIYSLENQVVNEVGEILEEKGGDIFYLKNILPFFNFLSKPNLRKNIFKLLKLFTIYKKYSKSWI